MKIALALIAFISSHYCFAQCPFAATIKSSGSVCAGSDTIVVSAPNNKLSKITWYTNNTADTTITAFVDTVLLQNGGTVAGGNGPGSAANQFFNPSALYVDAGGNIYVADWFNYRIQKFPPGSTAATNGQTVAGGNGIGSALNQFQPSSLYFDAGGNMYVADNGNSRILKFPPGSTSATMGVLVAGGNGTGPAANQFDNPVSVFVDGSDDIYVVDALNDRIQEFTPGASNGITVAGGNGYGPASNQFNGPSSVFIGGGGFIYVTDAGNNRIQRFPPGSQQGVTVAGGNGFGSATNQLSTPSSLFVDNGGNLYVADINNERILKFPPGSTSATHGAIVAGGNGRGNGQNQLSGPNAVWVDDNGGIYVCDGGNNRIQKFSPETLIESTIDTVYMPSTQGTYTAMVTDSAGCTVATNPITINPVIKPVVSISVAAAIPALCNAQGLDTVSFIASATNGGTAPAYQWQVNGADAGADSAAFTAVLANKSIVTCTVASNAACATSPTVTSTGYTISFGGQGVVALQSKGGVCLGGNTLDVTPASGLSTITWHNGTSVDTAVTAVVVRDTVTAKNAVTVAGGQGAGSSQTQLNMPSGVFVDDSGYIYVADYGNARVQKFAPGNLTGVTVAGGNGTGPALNQIFGPACLYVQSNGQLYVGDVKNARIAKFPPGSTQATYGSVAAGNNGLGGSTNQLDFPASISFDTAGYMYVCDDGNNRMLKFPPGSTGHTSGAVVAGGSHGQAANQFITPLGGFVDRAGNIYVCDNGNNRIQKFPPGSTSSTNGVTVAGGVARGAGLNQLYSPSAIFVDAAGNLYVCDGGNHRVLKFQPGSGQGAYGVVVAGGNGPGNMPNQLNNPVSLWLDAAGDIFLADNGNNRIQEFVTTIATKHAIDTLLAPVTAGTYTAVASDSAGCTYTTNAIVINPSVAASVSITADTTTVCAGTPITFTALPTNAGASPAYQWQVNGAPAGTDSAGYTTSLLAEGDTVACIVSDTAGCTTPGTSNKIAPTVLQAPAASPATEITISPGQSVALHAPVADNITSYLWSPPTGLGSDTAANPLASPLTTTTYLVKVTAAGGCAATDTITVNVLYPIMIPSAFTPNGDGRNDVFYVLGGHPGDIIKSLAVFNRWGLKVFQAQDVVPGDPGFGWNGNFNGRPQPPGGYVYIAVIASVDGAEHIYKGTVALVR